MDGKSEIAITPEMWTQILIVASGYLPTTGNLRLAVQRAITELLELSEVIHNGELTFRGTVGGSKNPDRDYAEFQLFLENGQATLEVSEPGLSLSIPGLMG